MKGYAGARPEKGRVSAEILRRGVALRCTGRLVTKKEGNYKFFLASDDGPWAENA